MAAVPLFRDTNMATVTSREKTWVIAKREVKMAGYWPSSCFSRVYRLRQSRVAITARDFVHLALLAELVI